MTAPRGPAASSAAVSRQMSAMPRTHSGPEVALRRELHARGLRFRVAPKNLPGKPDVVFTRARLAVFVDGCFWHRCPQHGTAPKSNADWWRAKLDRNVARDEEKDGLLIDDGWTVLHFWEHEPVGAVADVVESAWRTAVPGRGRVAG